MNTLSTVIAVAVGAIAVLAAAWRVAKAGHHLAEAWEGFGRRIGALEQKLSNGITADVRDAKDKSTEACRLAGVAATTASRVEQQATENYRATNALRSEVDVLTNVVLSDRQRIRARLREAGFELEDDE